MAQEKGHDAHLLMVMEEAVGAMTTAHTAR